MRTLAHAAPSELGEVIPSRGSARNLQRRAGLRGWVGGGCEIRTVAGKGTEPGVHRVLPGPVSGPGPGLILLTADRHEAEELAQEAMARAYAWWDRVGRMNSPGGYVYRTAVNLNRKRLRHPWVESVLAIPAPASRR
ncbi:MAG TPA: sigma factor [Actinomycetota bacterium]|jgi:hypothetical protein|nr:sigma factor [Actinomycetota bacterium]